MNIALSKSNAYALNAAEHLRLNKRLLNIVPLNAKKGIEAESTILALIAERIFGLLRLGRLGKAGFVVLSI